jgi:hypothetical protein
MRAFWRTTSASGLEDISRDDPASTNVSTVTNLATLPLVPRLA